MNETITTDGRNIGPLGTVSGEGATLQIEELGDAFPAPMQARPRGKTIEGSDYYGVPLLKEHVWKWMIPAYFYTGGLSAGASLVAAAGEAINPRAYRNIVPKCKTVAAAAAAMSGLLLIVDLGRPSRFLYMLRVFRPTSPMSIGTWLLSASGANATMAALLHSAPGPWRTLGRVATQAAGLLAPSLASYTAVLVSNTAVPVWQAPRKPLPYLFTSSAVASIGALLQAFAKTPPERALTRALTACGTAGELLAGHVVERVLGELPRGLTPLRQDRAGKLWKASKLCAAAGLGLALLSSRHRKAGVAAALLTTAGAICMRFGLIEAGRQSARDPRASFRQQRARARRERRPVRSTEPRS
jgi:formate-dependent nitrite reductase membrane component NrfD